MNAAADGKTTSPRMGEVGARRRVGLEQRFDRTPAKTAKARRLRRAMTDAERKLWSKLRRNQFGVSFRRQHLIGRYVLDVYCAQLGLVIELDGGQHAEQKYAARDEVRTSWLNAQWLHVLRFWNNDLLGNLDGVCEVILTKIVERAAEKRIPTPTLPFSRGGSLREACA